MIRALRSSLSVLQQRSAPEQGGILSGVNPTTFDSNDPFKLWALQIIIIIVTSRLCYVLFYKMRQPRVVAEILGGIILGPSVMGRIPGFSQVIFPTASITLLNLTATTGLVFFLFLAGLEIDLGLIKRHYRRSAAISLAGLIVPFGFGGILAVVLYHEYIERTVDFGHFALFTAIAVGITAFPILCRMLTELNLFDSELGAVVISAGVGNDVIGWVLLALAVSLTNSKDGVTAVYILLVCIGYTVLCCYPVRWGFLWLGRKTGSLETGKPSPAMVTCSLVFVIISAFFTDVIGLHAIFGGFLSGLVIPRDNGFAFGLIERLEDMVYNIFLPIYFTLSGLKTDLGLLNTGRAWGYTILVCLLAFLGKFIGCGITARVCGFNTREASTIGVLMSCKGLLELIVINLGLQAGILTTKVFAMFVVHAMILTFIITPLTAFIYPEKHRSATVTWNTSVA